MQNTGDWSSGIRKRYAARRRRQFGVPILLIVVILTVTLVVPEDDDDAGRLVPIGALVALLGLMFTGINWRCPACSKYLGYPPYSNRRQCSKCGVRFV